MRSHEYVETPDLGCWIEPNGTVHQCDHTKDYHHADIALEHFDIDTNDEGEHDDYSREAAIDAALDENWLRVSAIDTMGFTLHWQDQLTAAQIAAVRPILGKARKHRFDQYYLMSDDSGYKAFERFGDFLREFMQRTNSL